jgi:hypothetical protein
MDKKPLAATPRQQAIRAIKHFSAREQPLFPTDRGSWTGTLVVYITLLVLLFALLQCGSFAAHMSCLGQGAFRCGPPAQLWCVADSLSSHPCSQFMFVAGKPDAPLSGWRVLVSLFPALPCPRGGTGGVAVPLPVTRRLPLHCHALRTPTCALGRAFSRPILPPFRCNLEPRQQARSLPAFLPYSVRTFCHVADAI